MICSIHFDRLLACVVTLFVLGTPEFGAAAENAWPHWRGPNRNDVVNEPSGWESGKWRPQ